MLDIIIDKMLHLKQHMRNLCCKKCIM